MALISLSTDMHDSDIPGPQGPVLKGRPGINMLRCQTIYHVTESQFKALDDIQNETGMNAFFLYGVKLGYFKPMPEGRLNFNGMSFVKDEKAYVETRPNAEDLKRTLDEIREAKRQADYVMVSIHCHTFRNEDMNRVPEYVEIFAHECIDAGADAILGHGPHELRGIEIYNGKPVFYSLGNFIFETETVEKQPAEAYLSKGFTPDTKVGEYMSARSKNGTSGYAVQPPIWFSVIPEWTMEDGKVSEICLHPISLGMDLPRGRKGRPRLVKDDRILEHLQKLCEPYGTTIRVKDGIGMISLD